MMERRHWPTVSMADLAALCRRRGLDVDFLTERFRGAFGDKPGEVRDFFLRAFQGRYADVVVPWASVLTWYQRELGLEQLASGRERRCACACGQRVWGRKRWASDACRKRVARRYIGDLPNSPENPLNLLAPTRTFSAGR